MTMSNMLNVVDTTNEVCEKNIIHAEPRRNGCGGPREPVEPPFQSKYWARSFEEIAGELRFGSAPLDTSSENSLSPVRNMDWGERGQRNTLRPIESEAGYGRQWADVERDEGSPIMWPIYRISQTETIYYATDGDNDFITFESRDESGSTPSLTSQTSEEEIEEAIAPEESESLFWTIRESETEEEEMEMTITPEEAEALYLWTMREYQTGRG